MHSAFRVLAITTGLIFYLTLSSDLMASTAGNNQKSAQLSAGEPFAGPASEAKKLYRRYQRNYGKTVVAIDCVRSEKCYEPEDEVLRYSQRALNVLKKLDELAAEGDVQANYYRGLIAYERGKYYDSQAGFITHPDFILSATVFRRYAKQQFILAEKYLKFPAKLKNPNACEHLGNIYSSNILGQPQNEKATNYYYTAAIEYISRGDVVDGARMYNAMKENANPADPRIIKVYAKLHNNEPIAVWRKLPEELVKQPPLKKSQQH